MLSSTAIRADLIIEGCDEIKYEKRGRLKAIIYELFLEEKTNARKSIIRIGSNK
jgi:hypothetical protein